MSTKRLFVGNLPFSTTTDDLRTAFSAHGTVHDVSLVSDRETGRSRDLHLWTWTSKAPTPRSRP